MGGNQAARDRARSTFVERFLWDHVRPRVRDVVYAAIEPPRALRPVYAAAFDAHFAAREAWELAWRALVATPTFLARCARHGRRVAVDRVPYVTAPCRIEVGDDVRISGVLRISPSSHGAPCLRIGSGVFIGHDVGIHVAERVEIGDFASIGAYTYIADTEGHTVGATLRPVWEMPASREDIAPVVIEEGAQIGRGCVILKGVRIGARSVIGAGSVVRASVPPDSVVLGNPARVVKRTSASQGAAPPSVIDAPPSAIGA